MGEKVLRLDGLSQSLEELRKAIRPRIGDLAHPFFFTTHVHRTAQTGAHVLASLAAILGGLGGGGHVLGFLELRAEGNQGIDHRAIAGLRGGVLGQGVAGVAQGFGPDFCGGGSGGAVVLGAEAVGKGVDEDGIDGARGAVHGVFDDGHDAVDGGDDVVVQVGRGVLQETENGFRTASQANATVAITDDGIIAGDGGFSSNNTLKGGSENLLESATVHCFR